MNGENLREAACANGGKRRHAEAFGAADAGKPAGDQQPNEQPLGLEAQRDVRDYGSLPCAARAAARSVPGGREEGIDRNDFAYSGRSTKTVFSAIE